MLDQLDPRPTRPSLPSFLSNRKCKRKSLNQGDAFALAKSQQAQGVVPTPWKHFQQKCKSATRHAKSNSNAVHIVLCKLRNSRGMSSRTEWSGSREFPTPPQKDHKRTSHPFFWAGGGQQDLSSPIAHLFLQNENSGDPSTAHMA